MVENNFEKTTIRCRKLATIVSGRKNVAQPFVMLKHKAWMPKCSINILALMLTCFRLTKGCGTFFRPETIVASFLHLMVVFWKRFSTILQNAYLWRSFFVSCNNVERIVNRRIHIKRNFSLRLWKKNCLKKKPLFNSCLLWKYFPLLSSCLKNVSL